MKNTEIITHLGGDSNAVRQLGASQGQIGGWASDDDLGVGTQRSSGQGLAQIGDAGLITIHLPVSSDAEFAAHFV